MIILRQLCTDDLVAQASDGKTPTRAVCNTFVSDFLIGQAFTVDVSVTISTLTREESIYPRGLTETAVGCLKSKAMIGPVEGCDCSKHPSIIRL